mmetsp:Transcript_53184/g.124597  ORF Transcript_53184/g.124597 Transcript_53184/m.124597 type:complete len:211 (-) Transcript_53184:607-1239(-)
MFPQAGDFWHATLIRHTLFRRYEGRLMFCHHCSIRFSVMEARIQVLPLTEETDTRTTATQLCARVVHLPSGCHCSQDDSLICLQILACILQCEAIHLHCLQHELPILLLITRDHSSNAASQPQGSEQEVCTLLEIIRQQCEGCRRVAQGSQCDLRVPSACAIQVLKRQPIGPYHCHGKVDTRSYLHCYFLAHCCVELNGADKEREVISKL